MRADSTHEYSIPSLFHTRICRELNAKILPILSKVISTQTGWEIIPLSDSIHQTSPHPPAESASRVFQRQTSPPTNSAICPNCSGMCDGNFWDICSGIFRRVRFVGIVWRCPFRAGPYQLSLEFFPSISCQILSVFFFLRFDRFRLSPPSSLLNKRIFFKEENSSQGRRKPGIRTVWRVRRYPTHQNPPDQTTQKTPWDTSKQRGRFHGPISRARGLTNHGKRRMMGG